MNVLLLGSGGREHALAWKIAQSSKLSKLFVMPGSDAMSEIGQQVKGDINNPQDVANCSKEHNIDLVVIGPEAPLAHGVSDHLRDLGVHVFGPSQAAAQLETSKAFMKDIAQQAQAPTAAFSVFDDYQQAREYIRQQGAPIVVKADGLAAGKGVVVAMTETEALDAVDDMAKGAHGDAGKKLVIEEFMQGDEVSLFVLCHGTQAVAFGSAQDHKQIFEGDLGPNTGGMGSYAPAPMFTKELEQQVMETIVHPTLKVMMDRGTPYEGVLFCGLMLTQDGPKLVEFNARFGDPEAQTLMRLYQGDLLDLLYNLAQGNMPAPPLMLSKSHAMTVVMAAAGYPGDVEKGMPIHMPEDFGDHVVVFHAGTNFDGHHFRTQGGRVLNVTATGDDLQTARDRAYDAISQIHWEGVQYRRDIGHRVLDRK
ncbi:MAG: phosphoribosylamine--glycine ligase [Alphaproteobacteria bacterium]